MRKCRHNDELSATKARGGYSLYVGWYGCAAVLTPFFDILRIEHDLFGVLFLIHQQQSYLLGYKNYQFSAKIDLFGPKFNFFLDLFGSNFQPPAAHPLKWTHWSLCQVGGDPTMISEEHHCPEWERMDFNSLWSSDAIWRLRSRSTLAQVMAWCRQAQFWLLTKDVLCLSRP